uniref:Uncharacterized protein n=1 Tax=Timema monikensis TaxID=170555 RepID=A0A7R9DXC9_9NEOP|nr:unnamed protein product [Timema monikensis]
MSSRTTISAAAYLILTEEIKKTKKVVGQTQYNEQYAKSHGFVASEPTAGGKRFRFCGDLDCPDWILAEINTLAKMSSVKMKLLCQQVAKSSLGEEMDYDKVKKLTSDAKFEVGDVKASVAAVEFILTSSSRHDVEEDVLSSELQQLGLPREHSTSLVRVYSDNLAAFTSKLKSESLRGVLYDNAGRPEMKDEEDVDNIEELDAQQSFWHSSFEEGDCEDDSRHTDERMTARICMEVEWKNILE